MNGFPQLLQKQKCGSSRFKVIAFVKVIVLTLIGEKTLSDYDSNEDADYEPSESEDSDDELEFNSDASIPEDSEEEDEKEILVKEELVEEDAKI